MPVWFRKDCPTGRQLAVVHSFESSDSNFRRVLEVSKSGAFAMGAKLTTACSAASIDVISSMRDDGSDLLAMVRLLGVAERRLVSPIGVDHE